jgi:hypothetical protein
MLLVAAELSGGSLKVEQLFCDFGSNLEIETTGKLPAIAAVSQLLGRGAISWRDH